ncbi:MAG: hypothetical protein AAB074_17955 [Planctomycetota bacterium]
MGKEQAREVTAEPLLWRVDEAADFMRISPDALRSMMRRREIPLECILKMGKRRVRLVTAKLLAWIGYRPTPSESA